MAGAGGATEGVTSDTWEAHARKRRRTPAGSRVAVESVHPRSRTLCRSRVRRRTPASPAMLSHPASDRWRRAHRSSAQLRSCLGPHRSGMLSFQYRRNVLAGKSMSCARSPTDFAGGLERQSSESRQMRSTALAMDQCSDPVLSMRRPSSRTGSLCDEVTRLSVGLRPSYISSVHTMCNLCDSTARSSWT